MDHPFISSIIYALGCKLNSGRLERSKPDNLLNLHGGKMVGGDASWWRDDRIPFRISEIGHTKIPYLQWQFTNVAIIVLLAVGLHEKKNASLIKYNGTV